MTGVKGHCDEKFSLLRDAFANQLERGAELGASVSATDSPRPPPCRTCLIGGSASGTAPVAPWPSWTSTAVPSSRT